MHILAQNFDHADFWKILSETEEFTSSLYDNKLAAVAPNSYKVRPTTLPYSYNKAHCFLKIQLGQI